MRDREQKNCACNYNIFRILTRSSYNETSGNFNFERTTGLKNKKKKTPLPSCGLQQSHVFYKGRWYSTCRSSIHMNARIQGFPVDHCPEHNNASSCLSFCIVHPAAICSPGKRHTHIHPPDLKKTRLEHP